MAKKPEPPPSALADVDGIGWAGHLTLAVLGLLSLVASVFSFRSHIQPTLGVSLLISGVLLPILVWFSLQRSRAAWSFLIALSIVLGIMTLFGAPKVRSLVGIPMSVALVIPALFAGAVFCLTAIDRRYKN